MSKTQAQIQKEYRERMKQNNPEYLLLEREKKRLYRSKIKEQKEKEKLNYKKTLTDIFSNMKTPKGNKYSDITIKNYVSKINKTLKLLDKKEFNIKFFEDYNNVITKLKESKFKNLKDYMTPIVLLLKHFKISNDIIKNYHGIMSDEKEKENNDRGDNKLNGEDKKNFLSLNTINKLIDEYDIYDNDGQIDPDKLTNRLIVSFYFKNTDNLVPRNDLNIMKLISVNKVKNMNLDFNYISFGDKYEPKNIILNKYKTETTYGNKKKFNISKNLTDYISIYCELFKKNNGDYLFTNDKNQPYDKTPFLNLIKRAMVDVLKKPISIDLVRSIIITNYYSTLKSINDKKKFHNDVLLHSSNIGEQYVKIQD
jgi:hypothetical protein